jgi:hypothetical protein
MLFCRYEKVMLKASLQTNLWNMLMENIFTNRHAQQNDYLKGQSHEKVYRLMTWDGNFSLN